MAQHDAFTGRLFWNWSPAHQPSTLSHNISWHSNSYVITHMGYFWGDDARLRLSIERSRDRELHALQVRGGKSLSSQENAKIPSQEEEAPTLNLRLITRLRLYACIRKSSVDHPTRFFQKPPNGTKMSELLAPAAPRQLVLAP